MDNHGEAWALLKKMLRTRPYAKDLYKIHISRASFCFHYWVVGQTELETFVDNPRPEFNKSIVASLVLILKILFLPFPFHKTR